MGGRFLVLSHVLCVPQELHLALRGWAWTRWRYPEGWLVLSFPITSFWLLIVWGYWPKPLKPLGYLFFATFSNSVQASLWYKVPQWLLKEKIYISSLLLKMHDNKGKSSSWNAESTLLKYLPFKQQLKQSKAEQRTRVKCSCSSSRCGLEAYFQVLEQRSQVVGSWAWLSLDGYF